MPGQLPCCGCGFDAISRDRVSLLTNVTVWPTATVTLALTDLLSHQAPVEQATIRNSVLVRYGDRHWTLVEDSASISLYGPKATSITVGSTDGLEQAQAVAVRRIMKARCALHHMDRVDVEFGRGARLRLVLSEREHADAGNEYDRRILGADCR